MLAPEALKRTRTALVEYVTVLRRKGTERVRMVATSATRDAATATTSSGWSGTRWAWTPR